MGELERLERDFGWRISEHARLAEGLWVADEAEPTHYPADAHRELAAVEERSPWFRHRNGLVVELLRRGAMPSALWEVGAGNGVVARAIAAEGIEVVAVEPGLDGASVARQRGLTTICARLEQLELPDGCLPAIGLFDVIEHLPEPSLLLAEAHRLLAPGGVLLVTVPALPFLWSAADERAGHFRRYRKGSLDRLLLGSGFQREALGYAFGTMVLPVLLARTLPFRLGRPGPPRIQAELAPQGALPRALWSVLLWLERALSRLAGPPLGTSLAGRYRKR